jgi:hypothetical protein
LLLLLLSLQLLLLLRLLLLRDLLWLACASAPDDI